MKSDFLHKLSITEVWGALGGPPLRGRRGIAWWREGKHLSVAIDADRGLWYDHAGGTGGGVLRLVETVLGSSRAQAIEWCRDYAGEVRHEWTESERRDYARRRTAAEQEAWDLVAWRQSIIREIENHRNLCLRFYHVCARRIIGGRYGTDDELGRLMDQADEAETKYLRDDAALDWWRGASWDEMLALFRQWRPAA